MCVFLHVLLTYDYSLVFREWEPECLRKCRSSLVLLTKGRHFRGSRTPWHQSPQSPRQTGSIWAPSAPLAPADYDLYDESRKEEWTGSGRGKIRALVPNTVCSLVRNTLYLLEVLYDSRRCTVDIDQCLVSCFSVILSV